MAGLYCSVSTPGKQALAGTGAAVTLLNLAAPSNQRLRITGWTVSFDGTNSANTPAEVTILRQTTGSAVYTGTATPAKTNEIDGAGETPQAVGKYLATTEPTAGSILYRFQLAVFGGTAIYSSPPGQEFIVTGGSIMGWRVNAAQAVNADATVLYEE